MNPNDERFLNRLIETENGCLELPSKASTNGYKQIRTAWRRGELSHRVAMELHLGEPIPDELEVDHNCFNRGCANWQHLEVVTNTENNRRKPSTVLTHETMEDIRRLYACGDYTQRELAETYGISRGHVSNIITLRYWMT